MNIWKKICLAIGSITVTGIFPVVFLYCNNITEVKFLDFIEPLSIFLIISVVLFISGAILCKNILKGALISNIFMFVFSNYTTIESVIRKINYHIRYWHLIVILLFIFINISYFIYKCNSNVSIKNMLLLFTIVFSALVVINIIPVIPKIFKPNKSETIISNTVASQSGKKYPDVYYIILDEYSQFDVMEKYYAYYPTEFKKFLEENDFVVSNTSKNEDFWTHITNTNTLNLQYIFNQENALHPDQTFEYRKNPELFKVFNEYGYDINIASRCYPLIWNNIEYGLTNPFGGNSIGNLKEFRSLVYKKTPLYVLESIITKDGLSSYRDTINNLFEFIEENSNPSENRPKFVYVHIASPHAPFIFDADGNPTENLQTINWKDKKYYLGQYKYVTQKIQDKIEKLLKNNPDSVIILQSDHSARGGIGVNNILPEDIMPINIDDRIKILNAVYYKNSDIDIEGQSGLNTWRLVLNELFNLDYELLEVPQP